MIRKRMSDIKLFVYLLIREAKETLDIIKLKETDNS